MDNLSGAIVIKLNQVIDASKKPGAILEAKPKGSKHNRWYKENPADCIWDFDSEYYRVTLPLEGNNKIYIDYDTWKNYEIIWVKDRAGEIHLVTGFTVNNWMFIANGDTHAFTADDYTHYAFRKDAVKKNWFPFYKYDKEKTEVLSTEF